MTRQSPRRKCDKASARPGRRGNRGHDLLKETRVEMKRKATIPDTMLMTALEASSRITEHQGARHEGCPPVRGPVLKSAPCNGGHAYQIVLLF
jgi:hypothetical protein